MIICSNDSPQESAKKEVCQVHLATKNRPIQSSYVCSNYVTLQHYTIKKIKNQQISLLYCLNFPFKIHMVYINIVWNVQFGVQESRLGNGLNGTCNQPLWFCINWDSGGQKVWLVLSKQANRDSDQCWVVLALKFDGYHKWWYPKWKLTCRFFHWAENGALRESPKVSEC